MESGAIKKWHVALGLPILSAVLVWSYTQMEPAANPRTTSPVMFEQELRQRPVGKTNPVPIISNVRVYPPIDGVYTVNFDRLVPDAARQEWRRQEWSFTARTPRNNSTETILEWLERLRQQNNNITYTYEWWRESGKLWSVWGGASALLMLWGVVIPTIGWFAKGGMTELKSNAKATRPKSDGAMSGGAGGEGSRPGVTRADHDQLDEMIDKLEASSGGMGSMGPGAAPTATATGPTPAGTAAARMMSNKPLEMAPVDTKSEDPKDYKGEFYPVARAGQGKKE